MNSSLALSHDMDEYLPATSMRDKVHAIEAAMKLLPQIDIPIKHHFLPGIYARECHIPATAMVTGVTYKHPQINILSQGKIRVLIGENIKEIEASHTVVSPRGTKRIAYAVTDVVWTTIVRTDLTDIAEIEKAFFAYSEQEYQDFLKCQG